MEGERNYIKVNLWTLCPQVKVNYRSNEKETSNTFLRIEEGREESITEERAELMTETALRMLAIGKYAIDEIANISGPTIDEVNKLSKKTIEK